MKKEDLKNKIQELVREKAEKLQKTFKQIDEEEEKLVEPILILDSEDLGVSPEEILECLEEMGVDVEVIESNIPRYVDCEELVGEEPSVNFTEEEVVYVEPKVLQEVKDGELYIPYLDGVELDKEEIEELEEITKDIEPVELEELDEEYTFIPCVVNGQEKKLVDLGNCNIYKVPLLGLNIVTPKNLFVMDVRLDPQMESEGEMELTIIYEEDGDFIGFTFDVKTLGEAGLLALVYMYDLELELKPIAFRGLTAKVQLEELENLCKGDVE